MNWNAENVSVPVEIDEHLIDADAAFVVRKLRRSGFEAYLVGGSVRDLLLERQPKDFDVATSAAPEEIKRIFRRCRLIGRRFRLAHIMGQKGRIVETATFRSKPSDHSQDEIIWDDNEFGTVESDAHRRDFTINGMFYCTEKRHVLDFVGGLEDLERQLVRTIGEPITRFREDPVRMLRAIKFAARLDFKIESETLAAIKQENALIAQAAIPRLLEELIRMLRGGAAAQSISLMNDCGILELLVPETFALLSDEGHSAESDVLFRLLHGLDRFLPKTRRVDNSVVLAVLFWPLCNKLLEHGSGYRGSQHFREFSKHVLAGFARRLAVPRRTMESVMSVMDVHFRFSRIMRRRSARSAFSRTPYYRDACHFAELRFQSKDMHASEYRGWSELMSEFPAVPRVRKYQRNFRR